MCTQYLLFLIGLPAPHLISSTGEELLYVISCTRIETLPLLSLTVLCTQYLFFAIGFCTQGLLFAVGFRTLYLLFSAQLEQLSTTTRGIHGQLNVISHLTPKAHPLDSPEPPRAIENKQRETLLVFEIVAFFVLFVVVVFLILGRKNDRQSLALARLLTPKARAAFFVAPCFQRCSAYGKAAK